MYTNLKNQSYLFPVLIIVGLVLSACSTTAVTLGYDGHNIAESASGSKQVISMGAATDRRKHALNWLGSIRGGYGNPIKTLETAVPVKVMVQNAYAGGLRARNLLAPDTAPYRMDIVVNQFDCNQYARREAHIKFRVTVVETASSQQVFEKQVTVDKVAGSAVTLNAGIFGSVGDLRDIANQALQEAIDETLNDPNLVASIKLAQ